TRADGSTTSAFVALYRSSTSKFVPPLLVAPCGSTVAIVTSPTVPPLSSTSGIGSPTWKTGALFALEPGRADGPTELPGRGEALLGGRLPKISGATAVLGPLAVSGPTMAAAASVTAEIRASPPKKATAR